MFLLCMFSRVEKKGDWSPWEPWEHRGHTGKLSLGGGGWLWVLVQLRGNKGKPGLENRLKRLSSKRQVRFPNSLFS